MLLADDKLEHVTESQKTPQKILQYNLKDKRYNVLVLTSCKIIGGIMTAPP